MEVRRTNIIDVFPNGKERQVETKQIQHKLFVDFRRQNILEIIPRADSSIYFSQCFHIDVDLTDMLFSLRSEQKRGGSTRPTVWGKSSRSLEQRITTPKRAVACPVSFRFKNLCTSPPREGHPVNVENTTQ